MELVSKGAFKMVSQNSFGKKMARSVAIVVFGFSLPLALLIVSYTSLDSVSRRLDNINSPAELQQTFASLEKSLVSANDFVLYSLMYIEQSNQKTMMNKQSMKLTIIYIGFAIMSVGMMFMMLGINDGGGEGSFDVAGSKFSFTTTSTGLVIFIAGALMASGGALINNRYSTAAVPSYIQLLNPSGPALQDQSAEIVGLYKKCRKYNDADFKECLVAMVQGVFKEELK